MKRNMKKVLYFLAGAAPTEAETADAEQYYNGKTTVSFRNSRYTHKDEAIEAFDIVAGKVPPNYAAAALEKGEDALRASPIVDAASVPEGSPLAPDASEGTPTPPEGATGAAEAPKADKPVPAPKAPSAKPDAGWKPNA